MMMVKASLSPRMNIIVGITLLHACLFVRQSYETTPDKDDLITTTCKKSGYPDLCESSLRSNPQSATADTKGLARIMIQVSQAKARENFAQVKKLLAAAVEPVMKECLNICSGQYDDLIDDHTKALRALETNNFDFAAMHMGWAGDNADTCESSFGEPPNVRKSPLTQANTLMEHLASIAAYIINLMIK